MWSASCKNNWSREAPKRENCMMQMLIAIAPPDCRSKNATAVNKVEKASVSRICKDVMTRASVTKVSEAVPIPQKIRAGKKVNRKYPMVYTREISHPTSVLEKKIALRLKPWEAIFFMVP